MEGGTWRKFSKRMYEKKEEKICDVMSIFFFQNKVRRKDHHDHSFTIKVNTP